MFQTKSAFTRTYNKEGHMTPYAVVTGPKKKRGGGGGGGADLLGEEEDGAAAASGESDNEDVETDAMIKVKSTNCTCQFHT